MQVTCPNCRARYAVDPLKIGPSGRTVQCARCSERWFQTVKSAPPPEPPAAPPANESAAKPAARVLPWPFRPKEPSAPKAEPRVEPSSEPKPEPKPAGRIDTMPVTGPAPDFVIRPATPGAMLPALIEPKADRRMSLMLLGAVAILLLLAAGVLAFHDVIVDQLPAEWRTILHLNASALFPDDLALAS